MTSSPHHYTNLQYRMASYVNISQILVLGCSFSFFVTSWIYLVVPGRVILSLINTGIHLHLCLNVEIKANKFHQCWWYNTFLRYLGEPKWSLIIKTLADLTDKMLNVIFHLQPIESLSDHSFLWSCHTLSDPYWHEALYRQWFKQI